MDSLKQQIKELRTKKRSEPRTFDGKRRLEDLYNTDVYKMPPSRIKQLSKDLPVWMVAGQTNTTISPGRKKPKKLLLPTIGLKIQDKVYTGITPVRVIEGKVVPNHDIVSAVFGDKLSANTSFEIKPASEWNREMVGGQKYKYMSSFKHLLHPEGSKMFDQILGPLSATPQTRVAKLTPYFVKDSIKSFSTVATRNNSTSKAHMISNSRLQQIEDETSEYMRKHFSTSAESLPTHITPGVINNPPS